MMNLTIASVTNVFAQGSDFITNFTGGVFAGTPAMPGAEVIGPVLAGACPGVPNCQGFAGSAILTAGSYFLNISGTANGTSGYGGNLATFAVNQVPLPAAIWLFGGGLAGLTAFSKYGKRRRERQQLAAA
jgi:hypothetical protein